MGGAPPLPHVFAPQGGNFVGIFGHWPQNSREVSPPRIKWTPMIAVDPAEAAIDRDMPGNVVQTRVGWDHFDS